MDSQFVNVIFGVKVRQARLDAGLTLSEFARRAEISPSYATEVEKGRKYPRINKIMSIAEVLDIPFNDLVSVTLAPSLSNLQSALSSSLISQFPFDEFGLDVSDLVRLLTKAPDKTSPLISAMIAIGRQHDLRAEHILLAALRSYQELHENYFSDLEDTAAKFAKTHQLWDGQPVSRARLGALLTTRFNYELDEELLVQTPELRGYRAVFKAGEQPHLLINSALESNQVAFLFAREIGYQILGVQERAVTSSPDQFGSFQQVMNDFRASYFAGALMIPQATIINDMDAFFASSTWQPQRLLDMIDRYDVTPEMLLYRFSELTPSKFGIKLHFLRVQGQNNRYRLVKQLNMNRLLMPSGLALHEHYCRRWLVMRLLQESEGLLAAGAHDGNGSGHNRTWPHVGAQIDEFLKPRDRFFSFGFARPLILRPEISSSAIIGFQLDETSRKTIRFLDDPTIPFATINETCERCPLAVDECAVRAAMPTIFEERAQQASRQARLDEVLSTLEVV